MGNYFSSGLYEETEYKTTTGGVGYSIILEQPSKLMPLKLSKLAAERERYYRQHEMQFLAYYFVKVLFLMSVFATTYFKILDILDEVSKWCLKFYFFYWLLDSKSSNRLFWTDNYLLIRSNCDPDFDGRSQMVGDKNKYCI